MEIQLHSTDKIVVLNGIPARIWEGQTTSGIPIHAFITRVAVANGENQTEFENELDRCAAPSPDIEAYPLRMLI